MNTVLRACALLLLCGTPLSAQNLVVIPQGSTPVIDGTFSGGEWSDAATVQITDGGAPTTVSIKHNGTHLYVAYAGSLLSAGRFPELLLDPGNDRSTAWQSDDWWLHVSATDCEAQGVHSSYTNCRAEQPDWQAVPNMGAGGPLVDTVEIALPLSKVGIVAGETDTVGISFEVTNTFSSWRHWPAGAAIGTPSTWGTGVFVWPGTAVDDPAAQAVQVQAAPNPLDEHTVLSFTVAQSCEAELTIADLHGATVCTMRRALPAGEHAWQWNARSDDNRRVAPGVYSYTLRTGVRAARGLLHVRY